MNIELDKNEPQNLSISKNKVIVILCFGILVMFMMNMCLLVSRSHDRSFERGGQRMMQKKGNMMYGFNNQYPPMMQGYNETNTQIKQDGPAINSGATSATKVAPAVPVQ